MNINLEKTIQGVCEIPFIIDGKVFIILDQKLYPNEDLQTNSSIDISEAFSKRGSCPWIIGCSNDKLVLYNLDDFFLEVDLSLKKIEKINIKGVFMNPRFSCCINNGFSFLRKAEGENGIFGFYDFGKKAILWDVETQSSGTSFTKSDMNILCKTDNHQKDLVAYNLINGNKLWEKEIGSIGNYTDALGLLNEGYIRMEAFKFDRSIIFGVEGYVIMSIDILTGKENWRINTDDAHPFFGLDKETGQIHVIDYQQYNTYDANTGEKINSKNIEDIYKLLDIDITGLTEFAFIGNYLITVQCEEGILIVIDKNKGDLLWHHNFEEMVPVFNSPKILNDRLYILTKSEKLHVFKIQI